MTDTNTKAEKSLKKRYLTIAALSVLAVTGGAIGATVTTESTISENKITITEKPASAVIEVTGEPLKFEAEEGQSILDAGAGLPSGPGANKTTYTVTNKGDATAKVEIKKIDDIDMPHLPFVDPETRASFIVTDSQNQMKVLQDLAVAEGKEKGFQKNTFEVAPGASVTLTAFLRYDSRWNGEGPGTGIDKRDANKFLPVSNTFDVQFDYVTK
ncbi:hypothetical protein [Microbacterium resistens]|uniref:hypothetical protein n=1 Tax=Microbacterium resistens TaxID=156977 RepID=UPI000829FD92|nr:hypothetical protein [Microbacterium resistens]